LFWWYASHTGGFSAGLLTTAVVGAQSFSATAAGFTWEGSYASKDALLRSFLIMPCDRSALVGLVGGLNGAIFRRLTCLGSLLSVGSGVGSGLRGVGSGDGTGDGIKTARCGGPPSRVRAMRFPEASTAGMVPEELCRSTRRRRPACLLGAAL